MEEGRNERQHNEKKGQQMIQHIAKGRQYGVSNNGNKQHTLVSKGTLHPKDVFGGAQDRRAETEEQSLRYISEPHGYTIEERKQRVGGVGRRCGG